MPRTVMISGACGAGKTSILQLGYRYLSRHFGRVATIDTDWLLMLVDPRWELEHEEREVDLVFRQCGLLADSFFRAGFDSVLVGGNALHTRGGAFDELVEALRASGDVFHFTLDPALDELVRRVEARGGDKTAEWLEVHVAWMREKYESWTSLIDNSALSPPDTVAVIAERVAARQGLLASSS